MLFGFVLKEALMKLNITLKPQKKLSYYVREGIRKLVMFGALCVFTYSSYELTKIYMDYQEADTSYENMEDQFFIPDIAVGETQEPETDDSGNVIQSGTELKEFKFDYDKLLEVNSSAAGWIKQDNIISYPIVKGLDNSYYLTHAADHSSTKNGAIFVDYRIDSDPSNPASVLETRNCIIYGHNMRNGAMFGSLINYRDQSYYQRHKTMQIYVGHDLYTYHVFSAYESDHIGYTYTYNFSSDEEFQEYITYCMNNRWYITDIDQNVTVNDKIITLSTCTNVDDTKRFIVHLVRGEKVEE